MNGVNEKINFDLNTVACLDGINKNKSGHVIVQLPYEDSESKFAKVDFTFTRKRKGWHLTDIRHSDWTQQHPEIKRYFGVAEPMSLETLQSVWHSTLVDYCHVVIEEIEREFRETDESESYYIRGFYYNKVHKNITLRGAADTHKFNVTALTGSIFMRIQDYTEDLEQLSLCDLIILSNMLDEMHSTFINCITRTDEEQEEAYEDAICEVCGIHMEADEGECPCQFPGTYEYIERVRQEEGDSKLHREQEK